MVKRRDNHASIFYDLYLPKMRDRLGREDYFFVSSLTSSGVPYSQQDT